jgi:hypothetical protein
MAYSLRRNRRVRNLGSATAPFSLRRRPSGDPAPLAVLVSLLARIRAQGARDLA